MDTLCDASRVGSRCKVSFASATTPNNPATPPNNPAAERKRRPRVAVVAPIHQISHRFKLRHHPPAPPLTRDRGPSADGYLRVVIEHAYTTQTIATCIDNQTQHAAKRPPTLNPQRTYPERDSNPHSRIWPGDFKSPVSANSTIWALRSAEGRSR